jgi:hypothetical protein
MPRKGRGGSRQGTQGKAYTNRTDLNSNRVPAAAAKGQTYGTRKDQMQAQQAVPMAQQPSGASPQPAGGRTPAATPPGLSDPSQRPDEPLTAGMPFGPGPGPSSLTTPKMDVTSLRRYLPALEIAASQPDATAGYRNFVRRLRGAMPTEA